MSIRPYAPTGSSLRVGTAGLSQTWSNRTSPVATIAGALLIAFLLFSGFAKPAHAQGMDVTVHANSQFWIKGEATTHDFTCRVDEVEGEATLPAAQSSASVSSEDGAPEVVVRVPVRAFDCGNARMTRDLKETLKVNEHPEIRFRLVDASVGAPLDTAGTWRSIDVMGALTIAGTERLVRIDAVGHALDNHRFRVRGCRPVRMTYFNIEPPTKAFGLIRVKDRVQVQFDLLAHAAQQTSESPFDRVSVKESPSCPTGRTSSR